MKLRMLLISALLSALPSGVAAAADAKSRYSVLGAGVVPCGHYLKEVEANDWGYLVLRAWLNGHMTAIFLGTPTEKELAEVSSVQDVENMVKEFCEESPLESLSHAAEYVAEVLVRRAGAAR